MNNRGLGHWHSAFSAICPQAASHCCILLMAGGVAESCRLILTQQSGGLPEVLSPLVPLARSVNPNQEAVDPVPHCDTS